MADLALNAVLATTSSAVPVNDLPRVEGISDRSDLQHVSTTLNRYATIGYQASHFAQAMDICAKMVQPHAPSKAPEPLNGSDDSEAIKAAATDPTEASGAPALLVQPTIFLGATANLFGTGCREAIRFLCAECVPLVDGVESAAPPDEMVPANGDPLYYSFSSRAIIHALVVSGGAMEHDIRRACEPYHIVSYGSESSENSSRENETVNGRFGNIEYGRRANACGDSCFDLFSTVMRLLVEDLVTLQQKKKAEALAKPIPEAYNDVCPSSLAPSMVWHFVGSSLPHLFEKALRYKYIDALPDDGKLKQEAQKRAESTVLYWAALNKVPIFSPSFADGDVMDFIINASTDAPMLKLDLVADIHHINKLAMRSRCTGMIVLGGGVVKHHVLNANLMRNGADFTVIMNNGQEYDGSDAGARPDEAISWGKIRLDGEYVKVYSEISLLFPLLVAHVFVPYVRKARVKSGNREVC